MSVKVVGTHKTFITDDYGIFKQMPGNRNVEETHVKTLIKQIEKNGNLIDQFPIVVNEKMEILDGQHRLEALKRLGEPVVYEIREGLGIDDVRTINTTHRNWTWKDYAISYADLGHEDYSRLLNLHSHFSFGFSILLAYAGAVTDKRKSKNFYDGSFVLPDQNKTFKLLKQLREVCDITQQDTIDFALAMRDIMAVKSYDHDRMVDKFKKFAGKKLMHVRGKTEYQRVIEDIYNTHVSDVEKERLF